ncbi:DUF732 domain-containing protein [Mycetocola lacteus]|uniref:DUF732 domain-containing protein n=1 Tax=Mycetocola lacteus TaxID=76637 RepID=A0A3L7AMR4_9MICO|nr:DUF732 domain-containing protein [Mycetocola lacteus]RLP80712.1 DUF732 domain-containing protein [Mycetocola lacteus]RLP84497.1 DUF732 domain-containing protein [Mycetocola lacteus]
MKHRFAVAATILAVALLSGCAQGPAPINNGEFSARAQSLKSYSTLSTGRLIEFAQDYCSRLDKERDNASGLRKVAEDYKQSSLSDGRTAEDVDSFMDTATARYCPDLGEALTK